jgi:hypothetical protein
MSSVAIRIVPEPLRSLVYSSLSGTYMSIGTALANPSRILLVQNLTDAQVTFSFDGVNDNFTLPSEGFILLDLTANKTVSQGAFVAEGTVIYAMTGGTPTMGSVYVTTFYGIDQ